MLLLCMRAGFSLERWGTCFLGRSRVVQERDGQLSANQRLRTLVSGLCFLRGEQGRRLAIVFYGTVDLEEEEGLCLELYNFSFFLFLQRWLLKLLFKYLMSRLLSL